jgi:hypothetical protein
VQPRWGPLFPGKHSSVELALQASDIQVRSRGMAEVQGLPASWQGHVSQSMFEQFWAAHEECPLTGRNKIIASFCPQVRLSAGFLHKRRCMWARRKVGKGMPCMGASMPCIRDVPVGQ